MDRDHALPATRTPRIRAAASVWDESEFDPRSAQYGPLRASDADRDVVHRVLGGAYADGRINREEFDERSEAVLGARRLPSSPRSCPTWSRSPGSPRAVPCRARDPAALQARAVAAYRADVREAAWGFVSASIICWVIWGVTSAGGFPWPVFVMLGTGLHLLRLLVMRSTTRWRSSASGSSARSARRRSNSGGAPSRAARMTPSCDSRVRSPRPRRSHNGSGSRPSPFLVRRDPMLAARGRATMGPMAWHVQGAWEREDRRGWTCPWSLSTGAFPRVSVEWLPRTWAAGMACGRWVGDVDLLAEFVASLSIRRAPRGRCHGQHGDGRGSGGAARHPAGSTVVAQRRGLDRDRTGRGRPIPSSGWDQHGGQRPGRRNHDAPCGAGHGPAGQWAGDRDVVGDGSASPRRGPRPTAEQGRGRGPWPLSVAAELAGTGVGRSRSAGHGADTAAPPVAHAQRSPIAPTWVEMPGTADPPTRRSYSSSWTPGSGASMP